MLQLFVVADSNILVLANYTQRESHRESQIFFFLSLFVEFELCQVGSVMIDTEFGSENYGSIPYEGAETT
jgi:hypothetical protein